MEISRISFLPQRHVLCYIMMIYDLLCNGSITLGSCNVMRGGVVGLPINPDNPILTGGSGGSNELTYEGNPRGTSADTYRLKQHQQSNIIKKKAQSFLSVS